MLSKKFKTVQTIIKQKLIVASSYQLQPYPLERITVSFCFFLSPSKKISLPTPASEYPLMLILNGNYSTCTRSKKWN